MQTLFVNPAGAKLHFMRLPNIYSSCRFVADIDGKEGRTGLTALVMRSMGRCFVCRNMAAVASQQHIINGVLLALAFVCWPAAILTRIRPNLTAVSLPAARERGLATNRLLFRIGYRLCGHRQRLLSDRFFSACFYGPPGRLFSDK